MPRLALLSDLHMRTAVADDVHAELVGVFDALDAFEPDHVFVLGDLIEDEREVVDREHVRRVRSILEDAPAEVTYLLGNHDLERLDREDLSTLLGQDRFYGTLDVDGQDVIYLDSAIEEGRGARGELGDAQRDWLEGTLPTVSDAIVLVHHPIGAFDLAGNVWFAEFPERAFLGDRKEVLELFTEAGSVRATVSGHVHETASSTFRNLPHVSVNAFSKERPDEPLTGAYAELVVGDHDDRVTVRTRDGTAETVRF